MAVRACLHGGGGPQVGELSCKRHQLKMRDYMDWRVAPPKWVTSPTWGPPPPCKQALNHLDTQMRAVPHGSCIICWY